MKNNPSNRTIINKMVKLEKNGVNELLNYNSVNYWPAIRIRAAMSIIQERYIGIGIKYKALQELLNVFKLFRNFHNTRKIFQRLFITADNYKVTVGGKTYDRVLEYYMSECKEKGIPYAELNLTDGNIKYSGCGKPIYTVKANIALIKILTLWKYYMNACNIKNISTAINKVIANIQSIKTNHNVRCDGLYKHIIYLGMLELYFKKLLSNHNVKEIYQATYYDPLGLSLNAAASKLKIRSYCVQHGGQSRHNPAFGQWTNLPREGYEMLPDTFLCWDKWSANTIHEWSGTNNNHTAKVVGYKWAEMWKNGEIKYSGTVNIKSLAAGKMNILYTMQPSIGLLPLIISNMVNHFQNKINWWFRLHPRQLKTKAEKDLSNSYANCNNIFISQASSEPLPAIMSIIDLHITSFSSCVYEAMAFNIPTIFIDKMGQDYFDDIIKTDAAKLCISFKELKKEISDKLENYPTV
jgi:hypothetical protein